MKQVFKIETIVKLKGKADRRDVHYGVTSLSLTEASRQRLLLLARGHWCIENRVHWVRDVTMDEDRCRIRTGNGPQVMATLRNLVLNVLRLAGSKNIAASMRTCGHRVDLTLRLVGAA